MEKIMQNIIGLEQGRHRRIALATIILCLVVGIMTTPYIGCATMSYVILTVGLSLRKTNTQAHARMMKLGMMIDVVLVLILELTRSATATAFALKLGPLQQIHILFSTLAVLGYLPLFLMGRKILMGQANLVLRSRHRKIGIVTFAFRTIGFLFMFSMLATTK